jgi:hypothetical protein
MHKQKTHRSNYARTSKSRYEHDRSKHRYKRKQSMTRGRNRLRTARTTAIQHEAYAYEKAAEVDVPITDEPRSAMITKHHDALKGSGKKRLGPHGTYLRTPKTGWRCAEFDWSELGHVYAVNASRVASLLPVGRLQYL